MRKAKVLIVDDSAVMRRLLRQIITADESLAVQGAASNGRLGLAQIRDAVPDLVVLDIEMPEMDGLTTLIEIRKLHPRLPVIMFSTLTARGAEATIDSLTRGASDYVTKPSHQSGVDGAADSIRQQLIPKIKVLCGGLVQPAPITNEKRPSLLLPSRNKLRPGPGQPIRIVALGSSTGGPNALAEVISAFPADLPVPVVVTQHMPPMFTRFLAERLNSNSRVKVAEASGGEILRPGQVWIAPGNFHMTLRPEGDGVALTLNQEAPENSCRPSVDVMFRSVADLFGASALAVVLTGMGQDGLAGCASLVEKGSRVLVQDEPTSVVWGMPGYVARAGLAESVLPLSELGPAIVSTVYATRPALQRA